MTPTNICYFVLFYNFFCEHHLLALKFNQPKFNELQFVDNHKKSTKNGTSLDLSCVCITSNSCLNL